MNISSEKIYQKQENVKIDLAQKINWKEQLQTHKKNSIFHNLPFCPIFPAQSKQFKEIFREIKQNFISVSHVNSIKDL